MNIQNVLCRLKWKYYHEAGLFGACERWDQKLNGRFTPRSKQNETMAWAGTLQLVWVVVITPWTHGQTRVLTGTHVDRREPGPRCFQTQKFFHTQCLSSLAMLSQCSGRPLQPYFPRSPGKTTLKHYNCLATFSRGEQAVRPLAAPSSSLLVVLSTFSLPTTTQASGVTGHILQPMKTYGK